MDSPLPLGMTETPAPAAKPGERRSPRISLPALPDPAALFHVPPVGPRASDITAQRIAEEEAARMAAATERDRLQSSLGRVMLEGTNEEADRHEAAIRDRERDIQRSTSKLAALRDALDEQRENEALAEVERQADVAEAACQAIMALITGPYASLLPWLAGLAELVAKADAVAESASAACNRRSSSRRVRTIDMRRSRTPRIEKHATEHRIVRRDMARGGIEVPLGESDLNGQPGRYMQELEPTAWVENSIGQAPLRFLHTLRLPVATEDWDKPLVVWPLPGMPGWKSS